MQDIEKSRTSVRQLIRNPSGRLIVVLALGVLVILGVVFGPGEWENITKNYDKRPQVIFQTPAPPVVVWSNEEARIFFTEYAVANPPPSDLEVIPGIATCWDYVVSQTGEPPEIIGTHSKLSTEDVSLGSKSSVWSAFAGDKIWRFWENTRSVHGPC
ncbi:MAG: hypothetical protein HQ478_08060 [Chloroflexi bacterium]|nr:hypothetical protein [Chloroflexota bacterium]